jgi:GMP synthase-like glutamine amidotransferase
MASFFEGTNPPSAFLQLRSALKKRRGSDWGGVAALPEILDEEMLAEQNSQSKIEVVVNVVEPWEHVGHNEKGEEVRASVNVAYVAKAIGQCPQVVPLWKIRCGFPVLPALTLCKALIANPCVFEGGAPDVYDPSTFHVETSSREFLWELYKHVVLSRHLSQVCVFICLSHQLLASILVELVKDAVHELSQGSAKAKDLGIEIETMGNKIQVVKTVSGKDIVMADGFRHAKFATSPNEVVEAAIVHLHRFEAPSTTNRELKTCLDYHTATAILHDGLLENLVRDRGNAGTENPKVAMFHGVEVNYEAMVFCNWALGKIAAFRPELVEAKACPRAMWLMDLPVRVEIETSTKAELDMKLPTGEVAFRVGEVVTEVASMRLDYQVYNEASIRSSYSCQFHPELGASLRDARVETPADFGSLALTDGTRIMALLLNGAF